MTDEKVTSTPAASTSPDVAVETKTPQILAVEQEINALRAAHQFFSNFDRVPGFLANQWSQALDTIAVVANSLIAKHAPASTAEEATTETTESTTH